MSNYDDEQRAMDAVLADEEAASAMQVVGWILLWFCGITCVWIWVGWRSGTLFWFWVTLGLAIIGMGLLGAGAHLGNRAGKGFAARTKYIRSRAVASLKEAEAEERSPSDRDAA